MEVLKRKALELANMMVNPNAMSIDRVEGNQQSSELTGQTERERVAVAIMGRRRRRVGRAECVRRDMPQLWRARTLSEGMPIPHRERQREERRERVQRQRKGKGGDWGGGKGKGKKGGKGYGKSTGKGPAFGSCWTCGGAHFARDCPKGGKGGWTGGGGEARSLCSMWEVERESEEEEKFEPVKGRSRKVEFDRTKQAPREVLINKTMNQKNKKSRNRYEELNPDDSDEEVELGPSPSRSPSAESTASETVKGAKRNWKVVILEQVGEDLFIGPMHGLTTFDIGSARAEARFVREGRFDWDRVEEIMDYEEEHPDPEVRKQARAWLDKHQRDVGRSARGHGREAQDEEDEVRGSDRTGANALHCSPRGSQ